MHDLHGGCCLRSRIGHCNRCTNSAHCGYRPSKGVARRIVTIRRLGEDVCPLDFTMERPHSSEAAHGCVEDLSLQSLDEETLRSGARILRMPPRNSLEPRKSPVQPDAHGSSYWPAVSHPLLAGHWQIDAAQRAHGPRMQRLFGLGRRRAF